ncbi:hypothetical protein [Arthrobacter sp. NPDC057013]|uniref:hypothetical protein n=1 Tax=Arthrobacter sp. NPDC057013 TaxID=3345999 RepID=UPI003639130E
MLGPIFAYEQSQHGDLNVTLRTYLDTQRSGHQGVSGTVQAGAFLSLTVTPREVPETYLSSGQFSPPSQNPGVQKMNAQRSGFFTAVIMAGFAASTLLSGCGSPAGGNAAAKEVPVPVVATSSKKHADSELKTFTFPDGHISFAYPATWTVRTVLPPAGVPGVEAIVTDDAGNDLLSLGNGFTNTPSSRRYWGA